MFFFKYELGKAGTYKDNLHCFVSFSETCCLLCNFYYFMSAKGLGVGYADVIKWMVPDIVNLNVQYGN